MDKALEKVKNNLIERVKEHFIKFGNPYDYEEELRKLYELQ